MEKNCRLIIVEGIPGSGKSTASKYAAEIAAKAGKKAAWTDEGTGDHPADYEFHSFIVQDKLALFSEDEKALINACCVQKENGVVVPLNKVSGELFEKLLSFKIYDGLDWETEKPMMLKKWSEFAENAQKDTVYIFNCCLLQNPMCETMMRFGYGEEISKEYIQNILERTSDLAPAVIYLKQNDVRSVIDNIFTERPESWQNDVINYHINGAYGKEHDLTGKGGYISCLEERQRRELQILESLNCSKLIVEDPHKDWEQAYKEISKFVNLCINQIHTSKF
ncbi:MAG: hypothetical protein ACI4SF_06875 [Oscillospiraceae bacterium]